MHDEAAAFAHVESIIWPDGPVCPHCGVVDRAYRLVDRSTGRARSMVVDDLKTKTLLPILQENIAKEAVVYTVEADPVSPPFHRLCGS